jgi:hypothetical protein
MGYVFRKLKNLAMLYSLDTQQLPHEYLHSIA